MAATEYVILKQSDTDQAEWTLMSEALKSASADAALRAAVLVHGDGVYVATPARSWQPAAFKVQPRAVKS